MQNECSSDKHLGRCPFFLPAMPHLGRVIFSARSTSEILWHPLPPSNETLSKQAEQAHKPLVSRYQRRKVCTHAGEEPRCETPDVDTHQLKKHTSTKWKEIKKDLLNSVISLLIQLCSYPIFSQFVYSETQCRYVLYL